MPKRAYIPLTLVVGVVLIAACSGTASSSTVAPSSAAAATTAPVGAGGTSASSAAPVSLTIGGINNMSTAAVYVGVQKGFFLAHGIDAKFQAFGNGSDLIKALQSGTVQVSTSANTTIATAQSGGLDAVMFVPILNDATTAFYDQPIAIVARAGSGITPGDPASLVGKRVGMFVGGTGDDYLTRLLTKAGVDPGKVTKVNLALGNQLSALQAGQVDAISTAEPYGTQILDTMGSQAVLIARGGGLASYTVGLVATAAYIKSNPAIIQAVTDAMAEADAYTAANLNEAGSIATTYVPGLPVNIAQDSIKNIAFDPRISACTLQGFTSETHGLFVAGKITTDIPASSMVDQTFVQHTQQAFPQYFSTFPPLPTSCSG